jgi:general secretion pathway protein J
MTRRATAGAADGVLVVAWTRRIVDGTGTWLRWQSLPLTTRGDLERAWQQADIWSQNPGDELRAREVAIMPLEEWHLFYYRADAWTNPLSSDVVAAPAGSQTPAGPRVGENVAVLPDGVRLVLSLPPGQAIGGRLTRDWVRPTLSGTRS